MALDLVFYNWLKKGENILVTSDRKMHMALECFKKSTLKRISNMLAFGRKDSFLKVIVMMSMLEAGKKLIKRQYRMQK